MFNAEYIYSNLNSHKNNKLRDALIYYFPEIKLLLDN